MDYMKIDYMKISYNYMQMLEIANEVEFKKQCKTRKASIRGKTFKLNSNENIEYRNLKETVSTLSVGL